MANWYRELKEIDSKDEMIAIAFKGKEYMSLNEIKDQIDYEFDDGYGIECGFAFTAWSNNRVYFPVKYDGSEWITSVPRNPCDEDTAHVGGRQEE